MDLCISGNWGAFLMRSQISLLDYIVFMYVDLGCPLKSVGGKALMREDEDSNFLTYEFILRARSHVS